MGRLTPVVTLSRVRYCGSVASGGLLSAILSEQPDDVLTDLRRRLEKRIADARSVLAESESELLLVEQALAARRGEQPRAIGASSSPSVVVNGRRDREPDGRFHGIPRAQILAVASTVPYPITPPRVVEAFAERGEIVTLEQIRIALNRIAKDGNLTKVGPSLFAVPGSQTTETPHTAPVSQAGSSPDPFRQRVRRAAPQP